MFPGFALILKLVIAIAIIFGMIVAGSIYRSKKYRDEMGLLLDSAQYLQRLHGIGLIEQRVTDKWVYYDTIKLDTIW